jgi:DNA-binding CsgD family transcriptional regulator
MSTTTTTPAEGTVISGGLDVREHAASCGRLDCGHLGKSGSRAVRRAVILYVAEGAGVPTDLDAEAPEVASVLGILRGVQYPRPVYRGRKSEAQTPGQFAASILPNVSDEAITWTPQRVQVASLMWEGYSANEVAREVGRTLETVKSHMGYLRRLTGAHDIVSVLVAGAVAGLWGPLVEGTEGGEA